MNFQHGSSRARGGDQFALCINILMTNLNLEGKKLVIVNIRQWRNNLEKGQLGVRPSFWRSFEILATGNFGGRGWNEERGWELYYLSLSDAKTEFGMYIVQPPIVIADRYLKWGQHLGTAPLKGCSNGYCIYLRTTSPYLSACWNLNHFWRNIGILVEAIVL